jgi:predicted MPP superfamily phosphohydrolase
MRVVVLGDAHLIADDDPYKNLHERRGFFKSAWPSFRSLIDLINKASPDLVVMLGDLVDWFSQENISFGLELMSKLKGPWKMTPGNHDLAAPIGDASQEAYKTEANPDHAFYWKNEGVEFRNRVVSENGLQLILMDSPLSTIHSGTQDWLNGVLGHDTHNILLTHVPIDTPQTRDYILSVDANRSMKKYLLSGAPNLYEDTLRGRVDSVYSAHLHFPGKLRVDSSDFYLCDMSISMRDPNRNSSCRATAAVLDWDSKRCSVTDLVVTE